MSAEDKGLNKKGDCQTKLTMFQHGARMYCLLLVKFMLFCLFRVNAFDSVCHLILYSSPYIKNKMFMKIKDKADCKQL